MKNNNEKMDAMVKALKVNTNQLPHRIMSAVLLRLNHLGYTDTCERCGGCGEYSWNAVDGSRCYGCNGSGFVLPKFTESLVEKVTQDVADGKLEPYFEERRILNRANKAEKIVLDAWKNTGIGSKYNWMKASDGVPEDRRIADINKEMHDVYEEIQKQAREVRMLKGPERKVKAVALGKSTESAVEKINEIAKRI